MAVTLKTSTIGKEVTVKDIRTGDKELEGLLFSLGCYAGEKITVVSRLKREVIVSIKDGRYCIDDKLADAITVVQN